MKRKPIPILGTSITLDTPETVDAWIAERRKRWPSASRVQEKAQKMEDAIARGQVISDDVTLGSRKRLKLDGRHDHRQRLMDNQFQHRGRGRGTFRGRGREHLSSSLTSGRILPSPHKATSLPKRPVSPRAVADSSGISSDSDSGSDIDLKRDAVSSKIPVNTPLNIDPVLDTVIGTMPLSFPITANKPPNSKFVPRKHPPQPKLPPKNPFSGTSALLRQVWHIVCLL